MAAWRSYANLLLNMTKYVGIGQSLSNKAQTRGMMGMGDMEEHAGLFMLHETDAPMRDAFPSRWGDSWGDALD